MNKCKVSICTPAYKRPDLLKRLIDSTLEQTFTDFEFIITDDSGDDTVTKLVNSYYDERIRYFKNETPFGTPQNMNYAVSKANSEWIKVMHDDDWFASPESLSLFMEETKKGKKFIFSAYNNHYEKPGF